MTDSGGGGGDEDPLAQQAGNGRLGLWLRGGISSTETRLGYVG